MQPDVAPARQGHRVAEPLVGELVGDQPDGVPVAADQVAAERREALGLQRDLEVVGRDHDGVAGEGVRPEQPREHVDHLVLALEGRAEGARVEVRRGDDPQRHPVVRSARRLPVGVPPDLDRGEVRRHRLVLLVHPGLAGAVPGPLHQLAVGDHVVAGVGGEADPVRRLVVRAVVAGEPGGRPVRLTGHDHAVAELLPAGVAVLLADQRPGVAGVPDHDGELLVGSHLLLEVDHQPVGAGAVVAQRGAGDADLRDLEMGQVEHDPPQRLARHDGQGGVAGEPVAAARCRTGRGRSAGRSTTDPRARAGTGRQWGGSTRVRRGVVRGVVPWSDRVADPDRSCPARTPPSSPTTLARP